MICRAAVMVLVLYMTSNGVASAQGSPRDSAEIATAIAAAIQGRIPSVGPSPGGVMTTRPTSEFADASWNRLVGRALVALDTGLIATAPTPYTMLLNVVRVSVHDDSLAARVVFTTCRDAAEGRLFAGTGFDYAFRREGAAWVLVGEQMRGHGHGRCD